MHEGRVSPFVGRDAELTSLLRLAAVAAQGQASTALVSGEAGVGKTRLLSQLESSLLGVADAGASVVERAAR